MALALAVGAGAIVAARMMDPSPGRRQATPVEFALQDTRGNVVSDRTLHGRPYAILFGFTRCPDVCPTILARIARARTEDADSAAWRVMFVGIDTQHDSPAALDRYLSELAPATTGLTGADDQIEQATRSFSAFFKRVRAANGFTFDHVATVFLVDANGRVTDTIGISDPQDVLAAKLRRLGRS